jgi:hypothetical protein
MPGADLRLTRSRVSRPVVVLVRDGAGERVATRKTLEVAMARCRTCRRRFRVLPSDVLPWKRYGLAVIAELCQAHAVEDQSLRDAVWKKFIGQTPVHSTLHAWTEGLGAFVLGRPGSSRPDAVPFSAILAETTKRWPEVAAATATWPLIDPLRYRSQERCERLVAVASVLAIASAFTAATSPSSHDSAPPLCSWRLATITFGLTSPFSFHTGWRCTPTEHRVRRAAEASGSPLTTGGLSCPTRTRSPPGASSRLRPSSTPPSIARAGDA